MIARVIVELGVGLNREFDYRVPPDMCASLKIGARVMAPFGAGNREIRGTVVGLERGHGDPVALVGARNGSGGAGSRRPLKTLLSVCDRDPLIQPRLMDLARWMAGYYAAPIEAAVRALLPVAVRDRSQGVAEVWRVRLCDETAAAGSADSKLTARQAAVLDWLRQAGTSTLAETARGAGVSPATVRTLAKHGRVVLFRARGALPAALAASNVAPSAPPALMPQQQTALTRVLQAVADPKPRVLLLHGATGSGKTEVYLRAISDILADGGGALMLVPEIALTPQTVERLRGRFGDTVAVLHSHLSAGDRYEQWHRIHQGRARVAVGARSAVFAPVRDLRLMVVDEEHEPSYKQEESPRYQARDVAVMRGHLESCAVVLGSATPSLESYYNARHGKYELLEMPHRVDHRRMPRMQVVDMRIEAQRRGGGLSVFSRPLIEALRTRLERGEQTMLFLNRRGYASSLVCPACGFVAECDACSLALTYHRSCDTLICHWCDARRRVPDGCPACGDKSFKFSGIGTQRVESALARICPKARIVRMDRDTTRARDSYDHILGDFRQGKIDVLVGTQMIAKGLDFPNVTLIGVIQADTALHRPDFRASERTFQLLTQVAGRAGRGEVPGEVIVQTFTPYHEAVQAARRLDYAGFFDREIEFRRELAYPPHSRMSRVVFSGPDENEVARFGQRAGEALRAALSDRVTLVGPAPAPMARIRNVFRYHLMARSSAPSAMNKALYRVLNDLKCPRAIHVTIDVDAHSVM